MNVLRKLLTAVFSLLWLGLAGLTVYAMISHSFAKQMVDFLEETVLAQLHTCLIAGEMLWLPAVFALGFALMGILLLIAAFAGKKPVNQVKITTEDGNTVDISLQAIDNVVRRAVAEAGNVRNLSTRIRVKKNELYIVLRVVLPAGVAIPQLGVELRNAVVNELELITGIVPKDVQVQVSNTELKEGANGNG